MAERGVACNVHYKPLPMMTAYKAMGFDIADYPNAYHHYENLITLPLHTRLSDEDAGLCDGAVYGHREGVPPVMLRKWEDLPQEMQTEEVRPYYDLLRRKQGSLLCKRLFDILASLVLLVLLSPVFLALAIAIKLDSHGPVFYRQVRVTQYGREFRIFKFRTMVQNADRIGSQVTVSGDSRITRVGKVIRSCRLDEVGQLLNVLGGSMVLCGDTAGRSQVCGPLHPGDDGHPPAAGPAYLRGQHPLQGRGGAAGQGGGCGRDVCAAGAAGKNGI